MAKPYFLIRDSLIVKQSFEGAYIRIISFS